MLRSVARRGEGFQGEAANVEAFPGQQTVVGVLQAGGAGGDHLGAPGRQLSAAGDEVGVQMRLGRSGDAQAPSLCLGQVGTGLASRVDHQGAAVAEVNQVGAVAQPLVDEGNDLRHGHVGQSCPAATDRPARFHSGKPSSSRRAL